ncbi:MAG: ferritin-like domain-containing protein [Kofleriaceae bacterium]
MSKSQKVAAFFLLLLTTIPACGIGYFPSGMWGRPLAIKGKLVQPKIRVSDEWASGDPPEASDLDQTTRDTLADWWLLDAQKEHASVPAFARLAWQLTALGAPAELLERTYRAGMQEIRHARRCFALVSAYRGENVGVMPMPELADADVETDLTKLAVESLVDGCMIEGVNADIAKLALERATDPAVHQLLRIISVDEAQHAELAWSIIEWCVAADPQIMDALDEALARISTVVGATYSDELAAKIAACRIEDLHAHGRVLLEEWTDVLATRRAIVTERLGQIRREIDGRAGWNLVAA